jgi:hypothetical protein
MNLTRARDVVGVFFGSLVMAFDVVEITHPEHKQLMFYLLMSIKIFLALDLILRTLHPRYSLLDSVARKLRLWMFGNLIHVFPIGAMQVRLCLVASSAHPSLSVVRLLRFVK